LENLEFTVEYVSPIATAQKQTAAEGIAQVLSIIGQSLGPEAAAMLAQKQVDQGKLFRWLWDLFNNDPDLLAEEGAMAEMEGQEQMAQSVGLADGVAGAAQKGAGALKQISEAGAIDGGMDLNALMAQFQGEIEGDAEIGQQLTQALGGEAAPAQIEGVA
jgi:hypothetical protein